ncbi:transcription repressor OFP1 [Brachypodium distachyon]|uniref:Transcription repressor n=1 Tax=Brachypodium distachyon TaxID=15368 RepID=I1GR52_BRADI|nr:transcription repressor OFP1 [Brachypodium distachyon]KQK14639.1 hypothetical protein BRADI_1g17740v3 [Brachypodium distachyon]|eukprot:XP_003559794.1 transcription repressor OFP1 [Brachypodium distachyon]
MPGSWFYRLRRKRSAAAAAAAADESARDLASKPPGSDRAPAAPLAANRASYYVPSGDRRGCTGSTKGGGHGHGSHPKVRDTRFPLSPQRQHADIVFDVDRSSFGLVKKAMPMPMPMPTLPELDLKLRPILTRPAATSPSDGVAASPAMSPTARLMRRRKLSGGGKGMKEQRRPAWRRWLRESLVVVKESADPEEDFLASMAEMMMMAAADDGDDRGLEELLACYLALNAADHHRAIVAAFRRALLAPPRLHATIGHGQSKGRER